MAEEGGGEGACASSRLVTTQVAISRRVSRFELLKNRQEARRSRGRGVATYPHSSAWGWSLDAAKGSRVEGSGERHEKEGARTSSEEDLC